METYFDHEKLDVYKASIEFVSWTDQLLEQIPKGLAVTNQLDRASTSIPLNLAEGNGKFTANGTSLRSVRQDSTPPPCRSPLLASEEGSHINSSPARRGGGPAPAGGGVLLGMRNDTDNIARQPKPVPFKFTAADRCRFFDIARGSALECAACLDVLVVKKRIDCADEGKMQLIRIVSMLVGLIRSTSQSRVYEEQGEYGEASPET